MASCIIVTISNKGVMIQIRWKKQYKLCAQDQNWNEDDDGYL